MVQFTNKLTLSPPRWLKENRSPQGWNERKRKDPICSFHHRSVLDHVVGNRLDRRWAASAFSVEVGDRHRFGIRARDQSDWLLKRMTAVALAACALGLLLRRSTRPVLRVRGGANASRSISCRIYLHPLFIVHKFITTFHVESINDY